MSDMERELFVPFTKCTLTQSEHYIGPVGADTSEDMVVNAAEDQFAASLYAMATDLHSLIPDDEDVDDNDSDDGDFTPDTSTA
ncbi:hypothetical protein F0562_018012 [Nyssa sinensis]|uniref:Uncharacterized protein n=1 Tax=Nyssa sinensis TaxID=561372 RepID=A0A5J4Z838_9ASTE|nr:hypothetical protein F0562_018012 [Nyssa sinensis]